MLMYHCFLWNHIGHENYVYTKLCKCAKKTKIKYFKSPSNDPLIVLDYQSKNIEEDFHPHKTDNVNLSEKSTTQDVNFFDEHHGEACQLYGTMHDLTPIEVH